MMGLFLWVMAAFAHELDPAVLIVQQQDEVHYSFSWTVPKENQEALTLQLPQGCHNHRPTSPVDTQYWSANCDLNAGTIGVDGLGAVGTDVVVVLHRQGRQDHYLLSMENPSLQVAAPKKIQPFWRLGFQHIFEGFDHVLFLVGLMLVLTERRQELARRVVATVSAFTVAHSVTLAATVLGWVIVPRMAVEAVIAGSILFLVVEVRRGKGVLSTRPWIVAGVCGLLHGFGFAGALFELGLPEEGILSSLLFFNLGIEVGQLLVAACVLMLLSWFKSSLLRTGVASTIGVVASYWTVQRVFLVFFG